MATRRRRYRLRRRARLLLLVLVLGLLIFGIIRIAQAAKKRKAPSTPVTGLETVETTEETDEPASSTHPGLSTAFRDPDPEETETETEEETEEETGEALPPPELVSENGSMSCPQQHIYVRVARTKGVSLKLAPGVNAAEIDWSVDDTHVADIVGNGEVIGLQPGTCRLIATYRDESLAIPVSVRELYIEDGCTYVDGLLVANKSYSLPREYDPGLLDVTKEAFEALCEDAADEGLDIYSHSDYRSYDFQVKVYNSMVSGYSKEYADTVSARPGYSEHQTGYTIDCNTPDNSFAETREGKWLAKHCAEYGFIIRYPEGKEEITGYDYESWHIRYVGVEAAAEIMEQGITLEEYLDIDSYYHDDEPEEDDAE